MERRGVSTVVGIVIMAVIVVIAAGGTAVFFQSALEGVQDGPDVGFDNALEIVHVDCIGHEMRLTIRNAGNTDIDAASTRVFLYDNTGDLLQVTQEQDFSGKQFVQPDGVDTMTFTVTDAKPLTDEMPFELVFQEEGVSGVCSPKYDDAIVAAWSFDETDRNSTHVFDVVGGAHGALFGGPILGAEGIKGDGIRFNGTDDYVSNSFNGSGLHTYTIAAWVRWDQVSSSGANLGNAPVESVSPRFDYAIYADSSNIRTYAHPMDPDDIGSIAYSTDPTAKWYHVVSWRDHGDFRLYVDGVLEGTDTVTDNPINATAMNFGKNPSFSGDLFNGTVDDVRIYNRSLSAEEIRMDAVALTS